MSPIYQLKWIFYPPYNNAPKLLGLQVVTTLPTIFYYFSQLSSYNKLEFDYNGNALAGIRAGISEPKSGDAIN